MHTRYGRNYNNKNIKHKTFFIWLNVKNVSWTEFIAIKNYNWEKKTKWTELN